MLTNSTCFPPSAENEEYFDIPTSSRTSANFAPPHIAAEGHFANLDYGIQQATMPLYKKV